MQVAKLKNSDSKNGTIQDIISRINEDVVVIKDTSKGSDAYTFLCVKNGKRIFRKIAIKQTGGMDKLKMQLNWLLEHIEVPKLTKVLSWASNDDYVMYDMTVLSENVAFFDYIISNERDAWADLEVVLNSLKENIYNKSGKKKNETALHYYIETKILKNAEDIFKDCGEFIKGLLKFETLIINGKEYRNFSYFFGERGCYKEDLFADAFKNDPLSDIHGDLTIENLIFSSEGLYLIDPNVGNYHESFFLDYAKLLQSLHGEYEYLQNIKGDDIKIIGNTVKFSYVPHRQFKDISKKFEKYLAENFEPRQLKSIYLHEIVHWLRLMLYKIRKDKKCAVVYFAQLIILLNQFEENFPTKKKLAMVDLDGTLIDTKEVNFLAYQAALKEVGVSLERKYFYEFCNGKSYKVFLPILLEDKVQFMDKVHKSKKEKYKKYLSKATLNKPLLNMLRSLKESGYYLSIVTTASGDNCKTVLEHFGLIELFDLIVSSDLVQESKPSPEPFEYAVRYFNINKENCIIFEDSPEGEESAKRAGVHCFMVKGYN